jgi:WD40 repeat protein
MSSHEKESSFRCPDFIVADDSAMVVQLQSSIFEAIEKKDKKGQTLMHGIKSTITAIAVHPKKPVLAIAGGEGFVILWDYLKKDKPEGYNYEDYSRDTRGKDKDARRIDVKYTCM